MPNPISPPIIVLPHPTDGNAVESTFNRYMFINELVCIALRFSSADPISFSIATGNDVIFTNKYYPQSDGYVRIYDVDKLLEPYIPEVYADFYFLINGSPLGTSAVSVFRCAASVSEPAQTFIPDFYLTAMMRERDTAIGRFELLSLYTPSSTSLDADCMYYTSDGKLLSESVHINDIEGFATVDVSPVRFVFPESGTLIAYTVICGNRKARYRVMDSLPEVNPAVIFRNSFNCWETLHLTGAVEQTSKPTRSQTLANGKYITYAIEEGITYKAMTGSMRYGLESVAMDLARSKSVYLLRNDGCVGDEIVITDCDCKFTNEDDDIPDFSFTYRLAERRNGKITAVRPPKTFDDTFDNTYE